MDSFREIFNRYSANTLLEDINGQSITYFDILRHAEDDIFQTANRQVIFCMARNDFGGVLGYLSFLAVDSIIVMLSASIENRQLNSLINKYLPKYIWAPSSKSFDIVNFDVISELHNYCLIKLSNKKFSVNENLSMLLSTSGSTGTPKFVRLSRANLIANAISIKQYLQIDADDIAITSLPLHYSYGVSVINSHILAGAKIALTDKTFFEKQFWNFFDKIKATSLNGVPYHYEMLSKLKISEMALPSLRTLTHAGGRLSNELMHEFCEFSTSRGIKFFSMYGQTEAAPRIAYRPHELGTEKLGCIGVAVPGGKLRIENDCGDEIFNEDEIGELVYEGPNVFLGYAESFDDLAKTDEYHGKLRTGDLAKRDSEGDFYLVGRISRFIKLFGHRINLSDVESRVLEHGYRSLTSGDDNELKIYLENIDEAEAMQVKKLIAKFLGVNLRAIVVFSVDVLPMTESGKLDLSNKNLSTAKLVC